MYSVQYIKTALRYVDSIYSSAFWQIPSKNSDSPLLLINWDPKQPFAFLGLSHRKKKKRKKKENSPLSESNQAIKLIASDMGEALIFEISRRSLTSPCTDDGCFELVPWLFPELSPPWSGSCVEVD